MKKTELLKKIEALRAAQDARFARFEVSDQNTDLVALKGEIEAGNAELTKLRSDLEALESIEAAVRQRETERLADTRRATVDEPNAAKKPWTGLGEFLGAVYNAEAAIQTGQLSAVDVRLASGLNEAVGSDGGFAVSTDMSNRLIEQSFASGVLSSRCMTQPISSASNSVKLPAMDDKDRTTGNRWGGVRAYWTAEAAQITATTPKPLQSLELKLNKLAALVYMTDELLADQTAMQAYVDRAVPAEIAFVIDDAILRGNGVGKPFGILNSAALVSQAAEGSQTADTVNLQNVVKMYSRMPANRKSNAVWFINSEVFPQLQTMASAATSASQLVYMPPGGVSGAPYGTLFGRPIIEIEHASALGDVGDISFMDLSAYLLATKQGVQRDVSIHVKFIYGETAFRFTVRVDGKPEWTSVITPYKGSNTQSPFVVLAAR